MALKVKAEHEIEPDEKDVQIDAMIAVEESIREEENAVPGFLDEDAYMTKIFIRGALLESETVLCKLAELEEHAERISEEDAITARKALRVLGDSEDEVKSPQLWRANITAHAEQLCATLGLEIS